MWDERHICVLKNRKEVIDLLPNVKPRKAKWLLDELKSYFLNEFKQSIYSGNKILMPYETSGIAISSRDFVSMMVTEDNYWGEEVDYITPEGAALFIKMYRAGCFELKGKLGSTEELEKYAASGEELFAQHAAKAALEAKQKAEEDHWKEHPEKLPEGLFTAARLNAIMWHHGVEGMHVTMEIGGITVTKRVTTHKSNSGKTSANTVVFTWTSCDGNPREITLTKSAYEHNRRNDADRDWGLPG